MKKLFISFRIIAKAFAIILVFIMSLTLATCGGEAPDYGNNSCLLLPLVTCSAHRQGLNLDANNVTKVELLSPFHPEIGTLNEQVWVESQNINGELVGRYMAVINTYTDETHISALVSFFNSLTLTPSEGFVDTARPPENFRITHHDGTTDFIRFHFTSLFHNDSFFRITDDDRGLERTIELDNMLYGLHDETKRLR